jgi:ABC-type nitrate/sulfonate/bicarbonate transport system substrate-binding protein
MPDFIRVCIEMTGRTLKERRPAAVRFLAAEIEALRFAMSHRDETIRVADEITGMKPDDPRPGFVFDAAVRANSVATDLPLPLEKLDFMQKQLVTAGTLTRPGDIEKMIDKGLREEALALLAAGP